MKNFSYRFLKNVSLLRSLGICASCNNNTVNKHNHDNEKKLGSEEDEEDTDRTVGSRRKRKDSNDSELKSEKSPDLIKEEKIVKKMLKY